MSYIHVIAWVKTGQDFDAWVGLFAWFSAVLFFGVTRCGSIAGFESDPPASDPPGQLAAAAHNC